VQNSAEEQKQLMTSVPVTAEESALCILFKDDEKSEVKFGFSARPKDLILAGGTRPAKDMQSEHYANYILRIHFLVLGKRTLAGVPEELQ
jgi:hypothetical protein